MIRNSIKYFRYYMHTTSCNLYIALNKVVSEECGDGADYEQTMEKLRQDIKANAGLVLSFLAHMYYV